VGIQHGWAAGGPHAHLNSVGRRKELKGHGGATLRQHHGDRHGLAHTGPNRAAR
jgi:hypothetical protein